MSDLLDRRVVVAHLLAGADPEPSDEGGGDGRRPTTLPLLVVAGLGAPAWDCTAAGDRDLTFPLWGAMGGAAMVGLGLALARPEHRVLVVTGDGEALMGLTALATIARARPANLGIVVLDNERYGETGMQVTHTATGTDLAAVAAGCGFDPGATATVRRPDELDLLCELARHRPGPTLAVAKVDRDDHELVLPPRDGTFLVHRFRRALDGT